MDKLTDIMLVEDEADIREIASMALVDVGGFKLAACGSGQQALDRIGTVKPQLILLDAMMPNMDGISTFKNLRKLSAGKDVPIIFITARVQANEMEEYRKIGAIGVIAKPFNPLTLAEEITQLWNARP